MSEDRTQPPSKHRRQQAREQGQAVHSPELTAAVGWLVAVIVLGVSGKELAAVMMRLVSDSMTMPAFPADPAVVASRIRSVLLVLAWPLGIVLVAFGGAALAAHQLQVTGLFATSLIAPVPGTTLDAGNGSWTCGPVGKCGLGDGQGGRRGHRLGLGPSRWMA